MFSKLDNQSYPPHRSSSPWLLVALIVSLTLVLIQSLPTISRPGLVFQAFSAHSHRQCTPPSSNHEALMESLRSSSSSAPQISISDGQNDLLAQLPRFSSIRVVSLESRTDRRQHMIKLRDFLGLDNLFFSNAVLYSDPRVLEIVNRIGNHTKADKKIAQVGHVACRMSHQMAIKAADDNDDQITLILEDDVDIEAAFQYLSGTILRDVPTDWDIIFFGHTDFSDESRHGRDPRTNNFFIYKSVEPQGGHGYALSHKGRKLVLDLLENKRPEVYETDEGQPIDEIFVYLARLHRASLYSIIPDLIVQVPLFKSDIFGTPAGFEDGMHNKKLLDSSLNRIKLIQGNQHTVQQASGHLQPPSPSINSPLPVATAILPASRVRRDLSHNEPNVNHHRHRRLP